jgi:hypothetical protein
MRLSENTVMRKILGPKRGGRRLHSRELYNLYSSSVIIQVVIESRMSWTGHVERMGERRGAYRVLVGRPEGKRQLGTPILRRTLLKWLFKKWEGGHGLD